MEKVELVICFSIRTISVLTCDIIKRKLIATDSPSSLWKFLEINQELSHVNALLSRFLRLLKKCNCCTAVYIV